MTKKFIAYFVNRHLLTNLLFGLVFIAGILAWNTTNKEELPDITFNFARVSTVYSGASAQDVEYFVTKPLEEALEGVEGVHKVRSTSSIGRSNITVELEQEVTDLDAAVAEIRNAVLDVPLPEDILEEPSVRVFKTSKKAILDVALINKDTHLLGFEQRKELQSFALALENQLINLPEISGVNRSGYLQEEIQIEVDPDKLYQFDIPYTNVANEVLRNNVRGPAGNIDSAAAPLVVLDSALDTVEEIAQVNVQGGFEGKTVRLSQVADVKRGYERNISITKVNGHEAIMFSIVKSSSAGILDALNVSQKVLERFSENSLKGTSIELIQLDDESINLRNRLSIIGWNGAIGFILILGMLFTFLNKRAGIWVAMGIPFSLCFTMAVAKLLGYTINGVTLAAVIIVLGIVVDDAIVVAENISRKESEGLSPVDAAIEGTDKVTLPVVASIATTCVAFIPLMLFEGRFGAFIKNIPPIVILMLVASLIESIMILPGHMTITIPGKKTVQSSMKAWFAKLEVTYGRFLAKLLRFKYVILFLVFLFCFGTFQLFQQKFNFVMFPNEETRDLVLTGQIAAGSGRFQTADAVRKIEGVVAKYLGDEVIGYRTEIAKSRRGGAVEENKFRMIIEIVSKEQRKKSADELIAEITTAIKPFTEFEKVRFQKSRWGQSSGSPIEVLIQENNDQNREAVAALLEKKMKKIDGIKDVTIEAPFKAPNYKVEVDRDKLKRLAINPNVVNTTLRAGLDGRRLYEFPDDDIDVNVRITSTQKVRQDINELLQLPVENQQRYLVPLESVVNVTETKAPISISRQDRKRTTIVDINFKEGSNLTPLGMAEYMEETIFPEILSQYPTVSLSFVGEVLDTRESQGDLKQALVLVFALIYLILAVLFNSLTIPFLVLLAVPLGAAGVILAFYGHGKLVFGFYAAIGTLGMCGVVVNDAIILVDKLLKNVPKELRGSELLEKIASVTQTRLRAILLTTTTTVAGVLPTAYGLAGYDAMLAEMMIALAWGLLVGTLITLVFIPAIMAAMWRFRR